MEVSKSCYYDYIKRKPSQTKQRRERITKEVENVYKESHEIYGSPKITHILNQNGEKVSQKYIHSIMKENNWKARYIKPYIQTTISTDFSSQLENLLNRQLNPTKPDSAWLRYYLYMDI